MNNGRTIFLLLFFCFALNSVGQNTYMEAIQQDLDVLGIDIIKLKED